MNEISGINAIRKKFVGKKIVTIDQTRSFGGRDCLLVIVVEDGSSLVVSYRFRESQTAVLTDIE